MTIRNWKWLPSPTAFGIGSVVLGIVIYMIIVPSVDAYLEQFRERPAFYVVEELSMAEQLRVRSAKFAVFAIFTYLGACLASFLNVVAARAPRGQSVVMQPSACPQCGTRIRLVDNLPILSYMILRGRCHSCANPIPIRYFVVEWIGAIIFGSLFLFELVTGAANVPGFPPYMHKGILWIILYTKWPVVGIYAYHAAFFSLLLMLSLMDLERLRCPKWIVWSLLIVFASLPIAVPTLRPVPFDAQTPLELSRELPLWVTQSFSGVLGALVGWSIASFAERLCSKSLLRQFPGRSYVLVSVLLGTVLGWQATVTIAVLGFIAIALFRVIRKHFRVRLRIPASGLLLGVAMLHHPVWKWLANCW